MAGGPQDAVSQGEREEEGELMGILTCLLYYCGCVWGVCGCGCGYVCTVITDEDELELGDLLGHGGW